MLTSKSGRKMGKKALKMGGIAAVGALAYAAYQRYSCFFHLLSKNMIWSSERVFMWTLNINEERKLLILKISDTLTLNDLSEILKAIYDENDGKHAAFNRFADLSKLNEIEIDIDTVSSRIYVYRRQIKLEHPVKISLFIPQKYIRGFSYLYKSMLSDDLFSIEILETLEECAKYLSVDKRLLAT